MISKNVEHFRSTWFYIFVPRPLFAWICRFVKRKWEEERWNICEKAKQDFFANERIYDVELGEHTIGYQPKPWPGLKKDRS